MKEMARILGCSSGNVRAALEAVKSTTITIYIALKIFLVPKTTLIDTIKEMRYKNHCIPGYPKVLTLEKEQHLVKCILEKGYNYWNLYLN